MLVGETGLSLSLSLALPSQVTSRRTAVVSWEQDTLGATAARAVWEATMITVSINSGSTGRVDSSHSINLLGTSEGSGRGLFLRVTPRQTLRSYSVFRVSLLLGKQDGMSNSYYGSGGGGSRNSMNGLSSVGTGWGM